MTDQEIQTIRDAMSGRDRPSVIYGDETGFRTIFGDERFDDMVVSGDIYLLQIDDDIEVLTARISTPENF